MIVLSISISSAASAESERSPGKTEISCENTLSLCLTAVEKLKRAAEQDSKMIEELAKQRDEALSRRSGSSILEIAQHLIVGIALGVILTRGLQ
jgi:hypothetical protein